MKTLAARKISFSLIFAALSYVLIAVPAHAQSDASPAQEVKTQDQTGTEAAPTPPPQSENAPAMPQETPAAVAPVAPPIQSDAPTAAPAPEKEAAKIPTAPASVQEAKDVAGADLRAPSPKTFEKDRRGFFDVAVGPAYGIGFASDSLMYNVQGAYNFNLNERFTGKGIADLYMGSGSVSSRMMNFGAGLDAYLPEANVLSFGMPYVSGELLLGNGRNAVDETASGLAIGTGAGFKFQAKDINLDINAHYALLTQKVGSTTPSVLGLRVGANF